MDSVSQNPSAPSFYLSAPTSPSGCSPENLRFYSARSSPVQQVGFGSFGYESGAEKANDDEFEFETSKRLANGWDQEQHKYRLPARAKSFSTMAYADELFCNGQVLPLKLPPRLQSSVPTSPRSLSSSMRIPFAQRCTWNDNFDPFMVALEKVSEETSVRLSVHRRSHSSSPSRTATVSHRLDCPVEWDQEQPQRTKPGRYLKAKEPTITGMERGGSMYPRWVRSQTTVKKRSELSMQQSPTGRTIMKGLWLGGRVTDADFSHNEHVKPMKRSEPTSCAESKMQKVKSLLLRHASLKKETSESKPTEEITKISKPSYFKRLSLSFNTNRRKKASVEPKMAIVRHEPKLPRCLGQAPGSPMVK